MLQMQGVWDLLLRLMWILITQAILQASQVKNSNVIKDWKLRVDEKWDTIFKNKSKEAPSLSVGSKACLKYHVKGLCYSDCPFSQSHCSLIEDDKKKLDSYIKNLRGE